MFVEDQDGNVRGGFSLLAVAPSRPFSSIERACYDTVVSDSCCVDLFCSIAYSAQVFHQSFDLIAVVNITIIVYLYMERR